MSKLKTPLLSFGAHGTIGDAISFQRKGQETLVRKKPMPAYRRTLPQLYQRWRYRDAIFYWQSLTPAQKLINAKLGSKYRLTAYAYTLKYYLINLPDLLGEWLLDEKTGSIAYDTSHNANHGTIHGASPATGFINGSLLFDGLNDFVAMPSIAFDPDSDFTFEFILDRACVGEPFSQGRPAVSYPYITIDIKATGIIRVVARNDASTSQGVYSDAFPPPITGAKYHLAISKHASTWSFYLNGKENIKTATLGPFTLLQFAALGCLRRHARESYYNGPIDHVVTYNRVLTPAQILNHSERSCSV